MSEGGLSQAEIDALLASTTAGSPPPGGTSGDDGGEDDAAGGDELTPEEADAVGEIGNICMSSAATVLSMLLNQQVAITTPTVENVTAEELRADFEYRPATSVAVDYTEGVDGKTMFLLSANDAAVVSDLMMGGDGTDPQGEALDDMHLSAVSEAMNQMMGNAATAMAQMLGRRIDISSPDVEMLDLGNEDVDLGLPESGGLIRVRFELTVGELLQSSLMQIMPASFAKELARGLLGSGHDESVPAVDVPPPPPLSAPEADPMAAMAGVAATLAPEAPPDMGMAGMAAPPPRQAPTGPPPVVQPVAFPSLGEGPVGTGGGDISLLLDVPLQVTVELGRTRMRIKDVLGLVPGSIVELEKLAGEPVDILVNGKEIARGEVVVIDEEFGVRITDIASRAKRVRNLAPDA